MLRTTVILGALAASTLSPRSATAQGEKAQIMAVVNGLFDGMRTSDSAKIRTLFEPRARMISSSVREGQPQLNVESSIEGFLKSVGTPRPQKLDEQIWNERVEVDGHLASVWVDYSLFLGTRFIHCGVDHFLLVKNSAGAWQILELADTRRTEGCTRTTP
jgi:hypothetical protein